MLEGGGDVVPDIPLDRLGVGERRGNGAEGVVHDATLQLEDGALGANGATCSNRPCAWLCVWLDRLLLALFAVVLLVCSFVHIVGGLIVYL